MKLDSDIFKHIHRHPKQLIAFLVDAWLTVVAFGRGTGKTHGVTATWIYTRAKQLPRSTGFILSITYAHLIDTIIPAMQKSWGEMGLVEGVHYWIREEPPQELELDKPITPVDDPKYFIFWVNGSTTKLVSMDRQAMVNSKSFDYGAICEARKQDGQRIEDDVIPTIRGNEQYFGHCPEHGTILIESDLPKDVKGKWWLKYKKEMDQEDVDWIMQMQRWISELQTNLEVTESESIKKQLEKTIEEVRSQINEMRKNLVHWIEASTFDNIHALGEKVLRYLKRTLSDKDYDISVKNIYHEEVDDCFYPELDDAIHGYDAFNYAFIDKQEKLPKRDCRWDRDVNLTKALDVTIDYNLRHSCIDIYQFVNKKIRFLKHHYVLAPRTHFDMVDDICKYYEFHQTKTVNFIFNHTFTSGDKVLNRSSIRKEVVEQFKKNGWKVKEIYIGAAMWHETLYYHWIDLLTGKLPFGFMFNRGNGCDIWYHTTKQTDIRVNNKPPQQGRKQPKFFKNKKSERPGSGIPQQEATHNTESVDQILQYYLTKDGIKDNQYYGAAFG
jgi:hypothetical protein